MKRANKGTDDVVQPFQQLEPAAPQDLEPLGPEQKPVPAEAGLPAKVSPKKHSRAPWPLLILIVLACTIGGMAYWHAHRIDPLPAGIVFGNGRLEADPVDIATRFAGRISELRVDEGDMVKMGQVLAVMDTRDLTASLRKSEALAEQARKLTSEAKATLDQMHAQVIFADQQMERARVLLEKGVGTRETYDQRRQALDAAKAGESAARIRVNEAEHALEAANHDSEYFRVQIADNTLVAPRDGRIQYRIANVGEVLPAGGKVFTMLDVGYVYMDIYLPTLSAGLIKIGADARIVLDAYPSHPIPASVSFIADQAQFTPKTVETQSERDKLMFRIRVRIDPDRSTAHADLVRSGLPGVAYVLVDPNVSWPDRLRGAS